MDYKQIDTFEKVLEFNGETLEQFNNRTVKMAPDTYGYEKVKAIVLAMNGGKNVTSGYWPYFWNPNGSAVGFSFRAYFYDIVFAFVGARLLMIDHERAIYAGKTFTKEYSEYING
ncbi:hypothetical protein KO02_17580 [Sphingobacterium sp. ML3W]|uniref:hypothetical protein n=1 Tax=Sphingobacterium sp. ML3W TaxID=1538644 RepID=UPI0004F73CCE|nr:hypothetical protein [Sphingobacterium sp. ML3W]AIM38294.1 hypothetical protein KO02_17580 [Sphingobacterium sp. ML3W]